MIAEDRGGAAFAPMARETGARHAEFRYRMRREGTRTDGRRTMLTMRIGGGADDGGAIPS